MTKSIQADNWTNKHLGKPFPQLSSAPGLLGRVPTAPWSGLGSKWLLFIQQIRHFLFQVGILLILGTSSSHYAIRNPKSKSHLHHLNPCWFTKTKTHPGRVADMLSRMHLHCCRWWSFQILAVPSRLPLTNLAWDSGRRHVTLYTATLN